ncbi:MAG TPA: radical SAM protein [bacterium]|nr:radical SAM protein [bacterium]
MDLARYGGKVVMFSDTTGGGWRGLRRRMFLASDKSVEQLAYTLHRKLHRRYRPYKLLPFAQAVHLEVTNACNLKCVMCPRTGMDRDVGFMPRDLFLKIVQQLKEQRRWIESVALMGLGEPLLHKEFFDFAVIAHQAGLSRLYTSTNATLLDEHNVGRLLGDGAFDQVIVSLDGVSAATYEAVRPGCAYETVAENVARLFAHKRAGGQRRPEIELQILLMRQTEDEVEAFCDYWVPHLGRGDRILIKEADTFGGQVEDMRADSVRAGEPAERFACRQLWKDMSIGWDGKVTVCCKDVLYKLALGDVQHDFLLDLWNSKRWNGIRRMHREGKWDWFDPCNVCREWWI